MRPDAILTAGAAGALAALAIACAGSGPVRNAGAPAPVAAPPAAPAAAPVPAAATAASAASAADSAAAAVRNAARDSSEADALVARGMRALEQDRDSEAASAFATAQRLRPRLGDAVAGLALIEGHSRHFAASLALADSAVALGDTAQFLTSIRGRALATLGRCPEAVALLLPFVRANPKWHSPTPELAYCLLRLDRAPEAVAVMQVAVRDEPRAQPLQWALMEAFIRTQQLDSALAHAVYLKEQWPENGLWWIETGKVLVLLNRMGDAKLVFERGFQLRPGLADSLSPMDRSAWDAVRGLGHN